MSLKLEWGLIAAWGGNFAMTYTLAQFTADCRDSLMCNRDEDGHEEIREDLERLLAEVDVESGSSLAACPPVWLRCRSSCPCGPQATARVSTYW